MKLSSLKRIESKTLPGVVFVIRRITQRRRDEIDDLIEPIAKAMPDREEYSALSRERAALPKDASLPPEKEARWLELGMRASRLYRKDVLPQIVRLGLVRIEGLEIETEDGAQPATLDNLTSCCAEADALYDEIVEAVERERGLLPDEAKNSDSPSTLAAREGGKIESAENAATTETTTPAAA
jgi:hypothetical protein